MVAKQIWVSPSDDGWKVHSAGANRAAGIFETKAEALDRGREIAINKDAELLVQNFDGTIGMRNSYGKDFFPPKG
jgi:hypothetical protein